MSESSTQPAGSGPSLEQLLWRVMDRLPEEPALVDSDEFAAHIAGSLIAGTPAEAWVDRFFAGNPQLRDRGGLDLAQAIVQASRRRMHVYEFELDRLEYVVLQEEKQFVLVSEFGQFTLPGEDAVKRAVESAVIPAGPAARRSEQPRAYLVRQDGGMVAVDPVKLAQALSGFALKQASLQAVGRPGDRLETFHPRRKEMTRERELRALRENDRRLLARIPPPPRTPAGLDDSAIAESRPSTADTAVFVLLPDGSLARPEMGAATRWQEMVSDWALRAGLLSLGGSSMTVSGTQRFAVSAGKVTALFSGAQPRLAPGGVAGISSARGEGVAAARGDFAPVRVLGDDELATLVATGAATLVSGWRASVSAAPAERYWIHPEATFGPSERDRRLVARADPAAGLDAPGVDAPAGEQLAASTGQPLQLGQITGDPWADWALQIGEQGAAAPILAAKVLRARGRAQAPGQILVQGEPIVAFRAPDGTLVMSGEHAPIRLAAIERGGSVLDGAARGGAVPSGAESGPLPRLGRRPLAARSGALPATALAALQLALERTASAGGYKLPLVSLTSAPEAMESGRGLVLPAGDPRRLSASLAGPVALSPSSGGQVARLLLSMPFPNGGEMHVGPDLSEALATYLSAPVMPAPEGPPAALAAMAAPGIDFEMAGWQNSGALSAARHAALRFDSPEVRTLLARDGTSASIAGLPVLLRQAVLAGGDWTPGPGAQMPAVLRRLALQGPFDLPELAFTVDDAPAPRAEAPRPLGLGEDEIVIPLPLWTQMGRGRLSATGHVMASPAARTSYTPPLGAYRLVAPAGTSLLDSDAVPPPGTPGVIELSGPTALRLVDDAPGGIRAHTEGGKWVLGHLPVDDGETRAGRRGRIRIGAPIDPELVAARRAAVPEAAPAASPGSIAAELGLPRLPDTTLPRLPQPGGPLGTFGPGQAAGGPRPMAGALQSALRLSGDVSGRALPGRPSLSGGFGPGAHPIGTPAGSVLSRAAIASPAPAGSGSALLGEGAWAGPFTAPGIEGLPPGAWSGAHPASPGYVPWSYSGPGFHAATTSVGGVDLSGLERPQYPSLPTGLRFRYVSGPLWWSSALRGEEPQAEELPSDPERSLRLGLRAANSAASIWRSILFSAGEHEDLSGGMDRGHDESSHDMSGIDRRLDVLVSLGLVGGGAAAATSGAASRGPETVYVAMDEQGRAGPLKQSQAGKSKALAQAIDMRIVAAIPPSPPPLESMGGFEAAPVEATPRARGKGHGRPQESKGDDAVSHSKIEGSVDAVAQRVYHRIRRRIASDRERFGG